MGMFDTFTLRIPIQCQNCFTGAFYDFQTKELDCLLDDFEEGKPAISFYCRMETPEECEEKMREFRETELDFKEDSPFWKMCGMLRETNKPRKQLRDGLYNAYTYCKNCEKFFYVDMEVKNGFFIGVHND